MPTIPIAPKRPHPITQHGQTRNDDYFWMRYREDPAVIDYLKAENAYLGEIMKHSEGLQERLFLEMKARLKEDDSTVPERRGDYFYYSRTAAGKQYPTYCRKHGSLDAPEDVILDQNALAEGKSFCRLGAFAVSPDNQKLAFSVDGDGSEKCLLYVKDLSTGVLYSEVITNTYGGVYGHDGVAWASDNRTFFYMTLDDALRPHKLYRHVVGTDPARDVLVYHEADETFYMSVARSRSGAYIAIHSEATLSDEWRILPAGQPNGKFRVFQRRRKGIEYDIEHLGEQFFIVTNEKARNFKLMATPVTKAGNTASVTVRARRDQTGSPRRRARFAVSTALVANARTNTVVQTIAKAASAETGSQWPVRAALPASARPPATSPE